MKISFSTKGTANVLANTKYDFIAMRKKAYIFSGILILLSIGSLFTRGLNFGVDFTGGRTYVVRFDQNVNTEGARKALTKAFDGVAPEVKTFGPTSQIKITTKYLIEKDGAEVDSIIQNRLYNGLKTFYKTKLTYTEFSSDTEGENKLLGILSSQKIGPTIAYDIREKAYFAVLFALIIIFLYVAVRFKKWQYGVGGVVALFHDSLITIGMFSLFYGVMPFNMEVDQAFIAAILTIIGYSINDTVIIFDRIREYNTLFPRHSLRRNINDGLNSTLARTMNTSGTTIVVLLMIFVVPELLSFINEMDGSLGFATVSLIATSHFIREYIIFISLFLAATFYLLKWWLKKSHAFRVKFDRFIFKIYIFGPILLKLKIARFASTLSIMYGAGINFNDSLKLASMVTGNAYLEERVSESRHLIEEGETIYKAFDLSGLLPPLAVRMVKVGEQSGNMDEALRNVSEYYDTEAKDLIEKIEPAIEPILTVVMALMVGWVMMAVLGPVYETISKVP